MFSKPGVTTWFIFLIIMRNLFVTCLVMAVVFMGVPASTPAQASLAAPASFIATLATSNKIGGQSSLGDARDADIYPAVAFAAGRFLVVWLSVRNASGSTDGFDIYGVFINADGLPIGNGFRVSDSNTVARNSTPAIATNGSEFVVAWASKLSTCQIYVQRITDATTKSDRPLLTGATNLHSPSLAYNATSQKYSMAYVDGDDYLPPSFFGSSTSTCGNTSASTSGIKALEFSMTGDVPTASTPITITDVSKGAFRPRITFSRSLNKHLIVWEDRRSAGASAYRFDVYAQRLGSDLSKPDANVVLDSGLDYTNLDTSATWTPRPVVTSGNNQFVTAWFRHQVQDGASTWTLVSNRVPDAGAVLTPTAAAEMTFATGHSGQSPSGYAELVAVNAGNEFVMGFTSHQESVFGYLSSALVQRIDANGNLMEMNGKPQTEVGVGNSVDYQLDDQLNLGMAVNETGGLASVLVAYGKHAVQQHSRDFDVWSTRMQVLTKDLPLKTYTPVIGRS